MQSKNDTALLRALEALADPVRLSIVRLLSGKSLCACHIHSALRMSQPRVSRHLGLLKKAGLITCVKKGKWCHYGIAAGPVWSGLNELFGKTVSRAYIRKHEERCAKDDHT